MVTVTNYKVHEKEDGDTYIRLQLSGGINMVKSKVSGLFYATARRASIACTLSEEGAKAMIGTVLDGEIEKVESDPYDFTLDTGETVELTHKWVFVPSEVNASVSSAA